MTRALVDTSTFVWAAQGIIRLPDAVRSILESPGAELFVSIVTPWEIAIKQSIGRHLELPYELATFFDRAVTSGYRLLPIQPSHVVRVRSLPLFHRDPFDRMLVAQAQVEDLVLLTSDRRIAAYDVQTLW